MTIEQFDYHDSGLLISESTITSIVSSLSTSPIGLLKNETRAFRKAVLQNLLNSGWVEKPGLSYTSKITITAFKDGTGLCFQTGNVSRIYADLLKLQTLWVSEKITSGIIIVPLLETSHILGVNIASYERLVNELPIFSKVITMPLLVIGFGISGGKENGR